MRNRGFPIFFKIWMFVIAIAVGIGFAWQYTLYQDCRAAGNPSYKCAAFLSGQQVAVTHSEIK